MKLFSKNEAPEPLTPQPVEDVEARAAIQSLEQRIAQLEAQIAQLESKIAEAKANANANANANSQLSPFNSQLSTDSPLPADADSTLSTQHSTLNTPPSVLPLRANP